MPQEKLVGKPSKKPLVRMPKKQRPINKMTKPIKPLVAQAKKGGSVKKKAIKKAFKTHMMYDKKTGKGVKAPTMAKHLALKKKGYGHTKPKNNKK